MAKQYVVTGSYSLNVSVADSPQEAVKLARQHQLMTCANGYEVEVWDDDTGELIVDPVVKFYANGEVKVSQ